jgi:hypothetical protein
VALVSKSSDVITRDSPNAAAPPMTMPSTTIRTASRTTIRSTCPARAPSAMRMPISCVRWVIPYDSTPYNPIATSSSATAAKPLSR